MVRICESSLRLRVAELLNFGLDESRSGLPQKSIKHRELRRFPKTVSVRAFFAFFRGTKTVLENSRSSRILLLFLCQRGAQLSRAGGGSGARVVVCSVVGDDVLIAWNAVQHSVEGAVAGARVLPSGGR